jgi:hypothetical protein
MDESDEFVGLLPALRCLSRVESILFHDRFQSEKVERPKPELELFVAFFLQSRKHVRDFDGAVQPRRWPIPSNGGYDPHYLDMRLRNNSSQSIKAIEGVATYANKTGDTGHIQSFVTQNDKPIPPGAAHNTYMEDTSEQWRNGKGEVTVYVNRVRFEDNTFRQDNGSHSCALTTEIKP